MLEASPTPEAPSATRRRAILITMSAAVIVVIGMQAAINLAVPGLASGRLHPSASALVWLVDAYTIVFASLLIPGGAAGDRFGRRRVLCAGLGMFVVGCGVCAVATAVPIFVAGRALTGLGPDDHSLGRQPLQRCGGVQAHQPGDRHTSVGDDDLMTATRLIEPEAEISAQFCDRDIHNSSVHSG